MNNQAALYAPPRTRKIVNGVVTNYTLHGKNVVHMTRGDDTLHFFYDAQNRPAVVVYNGTAYAYVKNLQGDIISILDNTGAVVVRYTYDAWGMPTSIGGTLAASLGVLNPFRYRGYVYDEETGLYYLRSRYYTPVYSRFLSEDSVILSYSSTIGINLYSYCVNSPVQYIDPDGFSPDVDLKEDEPDPDEPPREAGLGCGNRYSICASGQASSTNQSKWSPNPYGKAGSPAHQQKISEMAATVDRNQYKTSSEMRITITASEAHKAHRIADLAVIDIKTDKVAYVIQVGVMNKNGTPVAREQRAMDDLVFSGFLVMFVPYRYR